MMVSMVFNDALAVVNKLLPNYCQISICQDYSRFLCIPCILENKIIL